MADVSCEWFPTLPSGSWAEWVTAVVAGLALGAAFWAGRAAWAQNQATLELLEVERQREDRASDLERKRAEAEERAQQADLVACWTAWANVEPSKKAFVAQIHNQSALPIYDVGVVFIAPDGERFSSGEPIGVMPPGAHLDQVPDALRSLVYHVDDRRTAAHRFSRREMIRELRAEISFRDTAGRKWLRGADGILRLLERPAQGRAEDA